MHKLLVQEYLETHTLGDLARDHGVYASFSKSGYKFSLNYDQIEAKEADPLAQQCRGLILATPDGKPIAGVVTPEGKTDRTGNVIGPTKILAYPMNRFFNYGQGAAADIDWSDPKLAVLEKLDGTLCIVYFDEFSDKWCVATRSVPEADLLMDNGLFTFRTLFEKALTETTGYDFNMVFHRFLAKECTYCFELTTPYNRIVVEYKTCGVTLLAIRNMVTLSEIDMGHPYWDTLPRSLPFVQAHTYTGVQALVDWVSTLNPMEHEGVVVKQGDKRVKIKNIAYVAYNKVRDALGTSERNCIELILAEKDDDVIPMLPEEIVKNLQKIKTGVQEVIKKHDEAYLAIKAEADSLMPGDKKTFAVLATVTYKSLNLWTAPFFQMFEGKSSNMKDFIMKSRSKDGTWGNSFLDKMLELAKK